MIKATWDLSQIYSSIADPKIQQDINQACLKSSSLKDRYRCKIGNLSPAGLLECLREFEKFETEFEDLTLYSGLVFAADMTQPYAQTLHDRVEKLNAKISQQLTFFSIELGNLIKTKPQLIEEPILANYRHMLERVNRRVKHQLSEVEEELIIEKDQFGVHAWKELQCKWLNTRLFEVEVLGKKKTLSYCEANGLLPHPDRATRESANRSIYGGLGRDGEIFASALRNICNDWVATSKRRKYASPMESSLIANDIQENIIDRLLSTVEEGAATYRQYLKLKAKLLGLDMLGNHDIIAPLPNAQEAQFIFSEAQKLVADAYSHFDESYASAVEEMFQKQHIDHTPRYGKRNGAFCASHYNAKSAYILQSFNQTLTDVFTLAHELGHATHDWYMSRTQTLLNTSVPSIVAETASIFGELLLTDLMIEKAKSDTERRTLLCLTLDEAGMTTFQVSARVWFEQTLYASIEGCEFLDYKTISNHWVKARDRIYGEAVTWFPEMDAEWTMKPHYYMANYRYYNYPYVYAQMFVYSLYERYLEEGKAFVPKLVSLLSAGSSKSPLELGKMVGLDVSDVDFWRGGLKVFERFLSDLKAIV